MCERYNGGGIHFDSVTFLFRLFSFLFPIVVYYCAMETDFPRRLIQQNRELSVNKITFKRTWSLSNAVCFKYVKYLTTNTAKVGHVTPSRPPLT